MNPLLLDLPGEFSSHRLLLRRYRPGDGALYYQMLQTNWDHLYEFLPSSLLAVHSAEDAEVVVRRLMADWNLRTLLIFGVWEKASGVYVGESYLANADWEVPRIEVGYFVVRSSTGKGYATEAARATIGYAFEHLKVRRVDLRCAADNLASQRVAEHCGFVQEGRFRQHHRKKDGGLVDMLWYGLLLSEWQKQVSVKPVR
ncbi:MAG TPA: GNAT family protein [Caldilineaceae bacterium]|nr:GNAT family protein [Caldilineaceae bacterium]